jgi:hypothetical protein
LTVTAVTVVALATFSGGLSGQGLVDGIKVTLPHPVTLGDKVLDPGEYEIRRASMHQDNVLVIFNKDKMSYETNVLTIPAEALETPEESKVILHHIGDKYYFDKIWMHGKDFAWEFVLPERVRAEQRELALTIPARFEATQVVQQTEPQIGLANQLDALAALQERDRQVAALAESERARAEEQERTVRERQAEFDRQAQLDRAEAERNRVAALRSEPAPALATEESEATQIAAVQEPAELPATATNWLAVLFSGVLLLSLSFYVRPVRE